MPPLNKSGLLLDTRVWIWLNTGSQELKSSLIKMIDHAAQQGSVYISAISVWEIATLVSKKRLLLKTSVMDWINEALSQPGVELIPLTPTIAIESTQLPNGYLGDPADRMIIATARISNLTLLTRDSKILAYAKAGFVNAHKV